MVRRDRFLGLLGLVLCLSLIGATGDSRPSLAPDSFDFHALVGDPPADGSPDAIADMMEVHDIRNNRTDADFARVKMEEKANAFVFAEAIGPWFKESDLPLTAALLDEAYNTQKPIVKAAKAVYQRPRLPYDDAHPMVKKETDFSFPSGHSTRGMMWAIILSNMFPDHKDAILKVGVRLGVDRLIGGEHYPTDIAAGRKLGAEIARRLLADPDFQAKLQAAEAECHAAMTAAPVAAGATTQP
jgi:acid phosphatase (class A)